MLRLTYRFLVLDPTFAPYTFISFTHTDTHTTLTISCQLCEFICTRFVSVCAWALYAWKLGMHSLLSHVNYINIGAIQCVVVALTMAWCTKMCTYISQIKLFFGLFLFNSQMEYDLWFVFCEYNLKWMRYNSKSEQKTMNITFEMPPFPHGIKAFRYICSSKCLSLCSSGHNTAATQTRDKCFHRNCCCFP